jgi:hypothetical protein
MASKLYWYHPAHGRKTWPELKAMFATVGGITRRRLHMLGWWETLDLANTERNVKLRLRSLSVGDFVSLDGRDYLCKIAGWERK